MMRYSLEIGARVIVAAARFVGLTEVRSNSKWDNLDTDGPDPLADEFKGELLRVGWQTGWPYCAAFCEAVWTKAYQGRTELETVRKMCSPSCLTTWRNAVTLGWNSIEPRIGAIGIMRKGDTGHGHAFLVRQVQNQTLYTIEANTSPAAGSPEADREGDGVYKKTRQYHYEPTQGLHLLGFVLPMRDS